MGVPPVDTAPMTVEEFLDFTDTRPDEEKWELIDGEPVLNASPSARHQWILGNLAYLFGVHERQEVRPWTAIPGIGVKVSETDLPQPDFLVRPRTVPRGGPMSRECDDIIVAFEILSPSTKERDLRWKRGAYMNVPTLINYVVIAQDAIEVVVFGRESPFPEARLKTIDDVLGLPVLGITLPLAEIYRDTGLGDL
jgi:Uma2 family endonuclease